jgi:hypothetical protein
VSSSFIQTFDAEKRVVQGGAGTWLAMESKGEMMPEIS